jgi:photosystem II stability/assembly factor-like uncharacterized protein
MTPEERELRRALDARSETLSPEFRARLATALGAGRPITRTTPTLAAVAAIFLAVAIVGVLLLAGQGARLTYGPGPASAPRTQTTPTPIAMPSSAQLSAPSANAVWVLVANEYLARSTDRGSTWEQRPISTAGLAQPEISFVSDQEGWLSTGGSPETQCNAQVVDLLHTTDAGTTWKSLGSKGIADFQCKAGLSFVDPSRGFLDAWDDNHAPVIYRTTDGGHTWAPSRPLPDPPGFKTLGAGITLHAGLVRAFGSTFLVQAFGQQSGVDIQYVFHSTDGGATWTYLVRAPMQAGNIVFVTASRWLKLIGPGQSIETTNAGASWHPYASDYSQAAPVAADFVFADSQVGYGTVRGGITRTVDGGLHWTAIETPGAGGVFCC